jgi:hypothetical protein
VPHMEDFREDFLFAGNIEWANPDFQGEDGVSGMILGLRERCMNTIFWIASRLRQKYEIFFFHACNPLLSDPSNQTEWTCSDPDSPKNCGWIGVACA